MAGQGAARHGAARRGKARVTISDALGVCFGLLCLPLAIAVVMVAGFVRAANTLWPGIWWE